jgi:hypothetical protein
MILLSAGNGHERREERTCSSQRPVLFIGKKDSAEIGRAGLSARVAGGQNRMIAVLTVRRTGITGSGGAPDRRADVSPVELQQRLPVKYELLGVLLHVALLSRIRMVDGPLPSV